MKSNKSIPSQFSDDAAFLSDVSPSDKVWDKHKASGDKVSSFYKELGNGKYAHRTNKCSGILEFALKENSDSNIKFKITKATFCRVRTCPVCQWRRSLVWVARIHQRVPKLLQDYPDYSMIFITLTVRNCDINKLKDTIKWMNESWNRMRRNNSFPGIGWLKSIEVTRSNDQEAHPHFHSVILVPNWYFIDRSYLTQQQWTELWRKSLKCDYQPIVNVKKVKLKRKHKIKLEKELGRELTNIEEQLYSLKEVVKYSVKESDLTSSAEWLEVITKQLHRMRFISMGGVFKEYMSNEEPEDLLNLESEEVELSETDAKFLFGWDKRVKRYRSI